MTQGSLYVNGGVKCSLVSYQIENHQLVITKLNDPQSVTHIFRSTVRVESKLAGLPREIVLENNDLLVCTSTPELDAWLDGKTGGKLARIETNRKWLIGSVFAVPLLLYALFMHTIPWFAVNMAEYVPYSIKQIASHQTLQALDYSFLDDSQLSADSRDSILLGFQEVMLQAKLNYADYDVQFRYSEEVGPNAFALPDGTIVFTDQLVSLVEQDQAILDAVLLHEIGHVVHNHSMQLVAETLAITIAITYFFGDLSGAIEAFVGVGSTALQNKFSRNHEWEADNYALQQLQKIGRSPEDFAAAMEKLATISSHGSEYDSWFETHPGLQDRIDNARQQRDDRNEADK